ncbi:type VII secretion system-associated protein [Actinoplanes sp. CA-252034]|uniref:type VII secretion system-associated protein n=1 Tax=Actinoplanes sp. CA-252034 TaxID=3239906 RepID=UPI003D985B1B
MSTENYFLLMDPDWAPDGPSTIPAFEAVIGVWPVAGDGTVGSFRGNPDYLPRDADAVADPLDALFRLAVQGRAGAEQIQLVLRDSLFEVALNGDGRPLIMRSPDDVPCMVIATSGPRREQATAPQWRRIDLTELVSLLPDRVDVLFNPGSAVPFRLIGDFVREALLMSDEEITEAYRTVRESLSDQRLEVVPWSL